MAHLHLLFVICIFVVIGPSYGRWDDNGKCGCTEAIREAVNAELATQLALNMNNTINLIKAAVAWAVDVRTRPTLIAFKEGAIAAMETALDESIDTQNETRCYPSFSSCKKIKQNNTNAESGIYQLKLTPTSKKIYVKCDMTTEGGAWTCFQGREGEKVNFVRNWADYKSGFGDPYREYYLGNDNIHTFTNGKNAKLRIDMVDSEGITAWAHYNTFDVGDEASGYKLTVGTYTGNATDSLSYHNLQKFTTYDKDNDLIPKVNCAQNANGGGGWWYVGVAGVCDTANLNGRSTNPIDSGLEGIQWNGFRPANYTLSSVSMCMTEFI